MTTKDFDFTLFEDQINVVLHEDIETGSSERIKKRLIEDICSLNKNIILDLKNVKYIDSGGINMLLTLHKSQTMNNLKFELKNLNETVSKILSLGHLDEILVII